MELNNSSADQTVSVTSMEDTTNPESTESTQVTTAIVEPGDVASAVNFDADTEDPNAEHSDAKDPDAEDPDAEDPDAEDPDAGEPDAKNPEAECSNAEAAEVGERQWMDLCEYIDYQCSKEDVVVNRADYAALPEPVDLGLSEAGGNVEDLNVGNEACAFPESILTDRQWNTAMNYMRNLNYMELRKCFNFVSDECLILTAPSRELRTQLVSQQLRELEGEEPRNLMRQFHEETAPIMTEEADAFPRGEIPVYPHDLPENMEPPSREGGCGPILVEAPIENNDEKESIVNPPKITLGNPMVEVFPIDNFLFVGAEHVPEPKEHDVDEASVPRTPQVVFPEFAIELSSPEEARMISVELTTAINNFWNSRIAEGKPVETFARDFFDFLADYEQRDEVFNMGWYCL